LKNDASGSYRVPVKSPMNASTRLSMNGKTHMNLAPPFVPSINSGRALEG
jgi:hypothetical protein